MRCEQHDLAAGPDGMCVVCRRERGGERSAAGTASSSGATAIVLGGVGGALLVVVAVGMGYRAIRDREIVAEAERLTQKSLPDPPAPLATPVAPATPAATTVRAWPGTPASAATLAPTTPLAAPSEPPPRPLSDVRIVVYTTQWCPVCKRAKEWLQANGIRYEERDVETSKTWASELRARNARGSIPTFDVEGQVSIGLDTRELLAMRERAAARKVPQ